MINYETNNINNTISEQHKIKKTLSIKAKENKQLDINSVFKKSRHYFIMTEGGMPIYSRFGDEVENNGILATFSAIMTKFTHFLNTEDNSNKNPEKLK